jgi:hypothetical protein
MCLYIDNIIIFNETVKASLFCFVLLCKVDLYMQGSSQLKVNATTMVAIHLMPVKLCSLES